MIRDIVFGCWINVPIGLNVPIIFRIMAHHQPFLAYTDSKSATFQNSHANPAANNATKARNEPAVLSPEDNIFKVSSPTKIIVIRPYIAAQKRCHQIVNFSPSFISLLSPSKSLNSSVSFIISTSSFLFYFLLLNRYVTANNPVTAKIDSNPDTPFLSPNLFRAISRLL